VKKTQSNYLNMENAVLQHFDSHAPVWTNTGRVAMGVAKVRSAVEAIHAAAVKQNENSPAGYTALRVRSYAGVTGNGTLTQKNAVFALSGRPAENGGMTVRK
jgi:hypothetical protein